MEFRRLGETLWRQGNLFERLAEGQIPGNRTLQRSMHEPVEDVLHIRSGTLDDPKSSAHGLGRQVVPFPKLAVELIERHAVVALRHVVESLPNRGDFLVSCLRLRMQPSPFIESLFRGQVGSVSIKLPGKKAVELAKFYNHLGRHVFSCDVEG